jgi:GntR family transcriptional regulator of arabinose operon
MIPKYQRIADELARELAAASNRAEKLPTEKELCARYEVSRQTVRQALLLLEKEGLITRRQGSGSYPTGLAQESSKNRIALLLPSDSDYLYPRLRSKLLKELVPAGFAVSVYLTEGRVSQEREILASLSEQPPAGLIADPIQNALPNPNLDLYEKLWAAGTSTVFLQEIYDRFSAHPQVATDSFGGARALASLLIEQKCTGIAGIFRRDTRSGLERYFGYSIACTRAGIPWDERNVCWFTDRDLHRLQKKQDTGFLRDFIRQNLGSCSGVIVQNDEIAYWLIHELQLAGRDVPDDVAVASFDNSYLCDLSQPRITSLAWEQDAAAAATHLLLAQLRGQKAASITLSGALVQRESC